MNIDKVIRINKKLLESKGFKYSWFPNEHTFEKDNFWITIFEYNHTYDATYYKSYNTPDELSFNFARVRLKDLEKNKVLWQINFEQDRCKSLKMFFDFTINNIEWLQNLSKKEIVELDYKSHLTSSQVSMLEQIKNILFLVETETKDKKTIWNADELSAVKREMEELYSHFVNGESCFKYGRKQRMLESTYLLTDSFKNLNNTTLGIEILNFQEMYYKA